MGSAPEIIVRSRNPYRVQGPAQIGFSGGRSSGYMLHQNLDAHDGYLPDDVYVSFENTGKEREETLVFIEECSKRWGVKVIWMEYCREWEQDESLPHWKQVDFATASRNGEPFDKMINYYKNYRREVKNAPPVLPNMANRMCTAYLKIKIVESFMSSMYSNWDQFSGIRYDEPRRYHKMMAANANGRNKFENVTPLYDAGITKADVNQFWSEQPFDLGIDSDFGNCDLCYRKSQDKLYRILAENPSSADWWAEKERQTGQVFRLERPTYHQMKWYAAQRASQMNFTFEDAVDEDLADCMCGD